MIKLILLFFTSYIADNRAVTAVEYGLFLAGISLAIVATLFTFGEEFREMLNAMSEAFEQAYAQR